jgi:hypothetical protein
MKNRAKCKICQSIIESMHSTDLVLCKCGAISLDGGDAMRCAANDWSNFLRVDDEGNEIIIKIQNIENATQSQNEQNLSSEPQKLKRENLIKMLEEMIASIERLPTHAMQSPISHYDLVSSLLLISEIFKAD